MQFGRGKTLSANGTGLQIKPFGSVTVIQFQQWKWWSLWLWLKIERHQNPWGDHNFLHSSWPLGWKKHVQSHPYCLSVNIKCNAARDTTVPFSVPLSNCTKIIWWTSESYQAYGLQNNNSPGISPYFLNGFLSLTRNWHIFLDTLRVPSGFHIRFSPPASWCEPSWRCRPGLERQGKTCAMSSQASFSSKFRLNPHEIPLKSGEHGKNPRPSGHFIESIQ